MRYLVALVLLGVGGCVDAAVQKARADSIAADNVAKAVAAAELAAKDEATRVRADSTLRVATNARLSRMDDTLVAHLKQWARRDANPARFDALLAESRRREERAAAAAKEAAMRERVKRIVQSARSETTMEGTACTKATTARVTRLVREHPSWDDDDMRTIACGWVRVGLTDDQLRASWGRPNKVNRTVYSFGVHEQWVYNQWGPYVYLEDGVVRSWQDGY